MSIKTALKFSISKNFFFYLIYIYIFNLIISRNSISKNLAIFFRMRTDRIFLFYTSLNKNNKHGNLGCKNISCSDSLFYYIPLSTNISPCSHIIVKVYKLFSCTAPDNPHICNTTIVAFAPFSIQFLEIFTRSL